MAAKQINIYAELSPELSSDVTDLKQVLKAIDAKIVWYNRRINNPKYKTQVPIKVKMLNALKEQITENPAIIRQHAVAYAEIAREQQAVLQENSFFPVGYLSSSSTGPRC